MSKKRTVAKTSEYEISAREFEALVRGAVEGLPKEFKHRLENITLIIRKEPTADQQQDTGRGTGGELLGLYEGVPLAERTHHYGNVLPDKITIFRGPILRSCRTKRQIRAAVRDTVLHEFAHYFGLSDEHMLDEGIY